MPVGPEELQSAMEFMKFIIKLNPGGAKFPYPWGIVSKMTFSSVVLPPSSCGIGITLSRIM